MHDFQLMQSSHRTDVRLNAPFINTSDNKFSFRMEKVDIFHLRNNSKRSILYNIPLLLWHSISFCFFKIKYIVKAISKIEDSLKSYKHEKKNISLTNQSVQTNQSQKGVFAKCVKFIWTISTINENDYQQKKQIDKANQHKSPEWDEMKRNETIIIHWICTFSG